MELRKCVYVLLKHGVVVYVGQTKDLIHRLSEHINGWNGRLKDFDSFDFIEIPDDSTRLRVESMLMHYFKPTYNKAPSISYQFIDAETEEEIRKIRAMRIHLNRKKMGEEKSHQDKGDKEEENENLRPVCR